MSLKSPKKKILYLVLLFHMHATAFCSILFYDTIGKQIDSVKIIIDQSNTGKTINEFNRNAYKDCDVVIFSKNGFRTQIYKVDELENIINFVFKEASARTELTLMEPAEKVQTLPLMVILETNSDLYDVYINNSEERHSAITCRDTFFVWTSNYRFLVDKKLIIRLAIVSDEYHKIKLIEREFDDTNLIINLGLVELENKKIVINNSLGFSRNIRAILKCTQVESIYRINGQKYTVFNIDDSKFNITTNRVPRIKISFQLNNMVFDSTYYIKPDQDSLKINWDIHNFKYLRIPVVSGNPVIHSNDKLSCYSNSNFPSLKINIYNEQNSFVESCVFNDMLPFSHKDNEYEFMLDLGECHTLKNGQNYILSTVGYPEDEKQSITSNKIHFEYSKYYARPTPPKNVYFNQPEDSFYFDLRWEPSYECDGIAVPQYRLQIAADNRFLSTQIKEFKSNKNYIRIFCEEIKDLNTERIHVKLCAESHDSISSEYSLKTFKINMADYLAYLNSPYFIIKTMLDSLKRNEGNFSGIFKTHPLPKVIRALSIAPDIGVVNVGRIHGIKEGMTLYVYRADSIDISKSKYVGTVFVEDVGYERSKVKAKFLIKNEIIRIGDFVLDHKLVDIAGFDYF